MVKRREGKGSNLNVACIETWKQLLVIGAHFPNVLCARGPNHTQDHDAPAGVHLFFFSPTRD